MKEREGEWVSERNGGKEMERIDKLNGNSVGCRWKSLKREGKKNAKFNLFINRDRKSYDLITRHLKKKMFKNILIN